MDYDLTKFDELVEQGYIRKVEKGPLVLYNYTDRTTYDKHWNEYTRIARGIIFEKSTGKLVAYSFPKFFNLGEAEETYLLKLPLEDYKVTEKLDGSLGIIYHYDDEWHMATRGSFNSEQAVKGLQILKDKYRYVTLTPGNTYLVEIIYPDNKIVVDYGNEEKLVLLSIYRGDMELDYGHAVTAASYLNMPLAKSYTHTICQMIELQQTIPKNEEGFVVRFESGLRVKIKGAEYMRIHKMISQMSPLSFWESMQGGVVNRDYVTQLPEEFRADFEPILNSLEAQYKSVILEIQADLDNLPKVDIETKEGKKTIGLLVQGANSLKHPGAMFSALLDKHQAINKYIMNHIRPTGNVLIESKVL